MDGTFSNEDFLNGQHDVPSVFDILFIYQRTQKLDDRFLNISENLFIQEDNNCATALELYKNG